MVKVTYNAKPGDPVTTEWQGFQFEHGKPVDVPDDHPIVKAVANNDWFATPDKKRDNKPKSDEPDTPEAYFRYAVEWLGRARTSGEVQSRWDSENAIRTRVGWGSDDEDKIRPILSPKLDSLKKAEKQMGG